MLIDGYEIREAFIDGYEIRETGTAGEEGVTLAAAAMEYAYDKEKNLLKFETLIDLAAQKGAQLLAIPEQSLQGYVWEDEESSWELKPDVLQYHYENAETIPGPSTERLQELARQHGMVISFGMTERHATYGKGKGGLYNAAVILSGDGVLGVHRKAHICGSEKHIYSRGREFSVVDSDLGRIGAVICYDLLFPEAARSVAVLGADILVFITAWPKVLDPPVLKHLPVLDKGERYYFYDALLGVRAWENQMWLVAAGAAGVDARGSGGVKLPFDWQGQAKIVGPDGVTRVETPLFVEGLAVAHGCRITDEITTARTEAVWGDSFMFDRNPRAYGPLADEDVMYPPPVPPVHRQSHGSE